MNVGGKYDRVKEALIFTKCLGLNDIVAQRTQKANPETGETELIDCLNITTTPDGAVEKIPALITEFTHSAPVTTISAGTRFIYQDAVDTKEWNGAAHITIGTVLTGPIVHTPISVRIAAGSVYSSPASGYPLVTTRLGDLSNIPDRDKKPYYSQPVFTKSFIYNGHLYGVNAVKPTFLQYSEYAHHDVWALGNNFLGHDRAIVDAGAIVSEKPGQTGCVICTHEDGITVYDGANISDFNQKFFAIAVLPGTLYSGFISKAYGYSHVLLGEDGIYAIDPDGVIVNLTVNTFQHLGSLNSVYYAATVIDGKYLAFGDAVCIEYDFRTKTATKRAPMGIVSATNWSNKGYVASGSLVSSFGASDVLETFGSSITFPYANLGVIGAKAIEDLYFTGTMSGMVTITATSNDGSWVKEFDGPGTVFNYRIQTPRKVLGNHVSFRIEVAGAFRLETLRATFVPSYRSK